MKNMQVNKVLVLLLFSVFSIMFLYTPMQYGLFFEEHIYIWEIVINSIFLITVLYFFKDIKLIVYIFFLIPICFGISYINAESPIQSIEETLRWTAYASLFGSLYILNMKYDLKKWMGLILYFTGSYLAIFGHLNLWGVIEFQDAILKGRMAGPLQYPNTFGLIMAVTWIFSLVLISQRELSKKLMYVYSIFVPVIGSALLLSYSRGVFILVPVVWFLALLLLNSKQQLNLIYNTVISLIFSLMVLAFSGSSMTSLDIGISLLSLLVSMFVMVLIIKFPLYKHINTEKFIKNKWVLPIVIVIFLILFVVDLVFEGLLYNFLPESLQSKISSISLGASSVVGRMIFYKQAWEMSKESPLIGFGGDGWRILFTKFQEVPYWARETHNFYLEQLLNIGWLGLSVTIAVFTFMIILIAKQIKNNTETHGISRAVLPAITMIILHGALDFDFSFGTTLIFLVWLFILGISVNNETKTTKKVIYGCNFIFLFVLCTVLFFNSQIYAAHSITSNESGQRMTLSEAEKKYVEAIDKNPFNTNYYIKLSNIYLKSYQNNNNEMLKARSIQLMEKAYKLEPHNPEVLYKIGTIFSEFQETKKALKFYRKALNYDRFNVKYASSYIIQSVLYGEYILKQNSVSKSRDLISKAIEQYRITMKYKNKYEIKNFPDKRELDLSPRAQLYVSEGYLILGQYKDSIDVLSKIKFTEDQPEWNRARTIEYIAYSKIGNQDKAKQIKEYLVANGNAKYIDYFMNLLPKQ